MSEPNYDKISITVCGEEVVLDPENLKFNEASLSKFLENESSYYDYFGRCLSNAVAEFSALKELSEVEYFRAFDNHKSEGGTEKLVEARSRTEPVVIEAREKVVNAERNVKLLKQHLRSFEHSHANSKSMAYTLSKELDMLSPRIYSNNNNSSSHSSSDDLEDRLASLYTKK